MKTMIAVMVLMVGLNAGPASAESRDEFSEKINKIIVANVEETNKTIAESAANLKLAEDLFALGFGCDTRENCTLYFNNTGAGSCGATFTMSVLRFRVSGRNLNVNSKKVMSADSATAFLSKTQNLELIKDTIRKIEETGLLFRLPYADRSCAVATQVDFYQEYNKAFKEQNDYFFNREKESEKSVNSATKGSSSSCVGTWLSYGNSIAKAMAACSNDCVATWLSYGNSIATARAGCGN